MSGLTAFVGVTGLVVTGFLVLARLSQRVVEEGDGNETVDPGGRRDTATAEGWEGHSTAEPSASSAPDTEVASAPADYGEGKTGGAGNRGVRDVETRDASDRVTAVDGDAHTPEYGGSVGGVESMSAGALLANVALTQGLFGGLLAAAAWYFGVPGSALGLWGGPVEGPTAVAVGVAFGLALWVGNEVASALADAAGAAYDEELRTLLAPETAGGWLVLLGATLPIIALVEEFLFRAATIGVTAAAFPVSPWALAVVSSWAFALGHGAQGRVGVVVTGALGFALAAGFVLTGSALVVVVAHYLVNALEFGLHEGLGLPDPVWS